MCSEVCPYPRTPVSCDPGRDSAHRPMTCDSGSDFEFKFDGSRLEFESSQSFADELFADGMILPIFHGADNLSAITPRRIPLPPPPNPENAKKEPVMPGLCSRPEARSVSRSYFWGSRRSASFNTDKKRLIFFSLPLLSRSNSTGSVPSPKPALQKQASIKMMKSSSFSASSSSSSTSVYDRPQWNQKIPSPRKTRHGSWNRAHRVSPILNVPSPYIIGAANLLGLSSFFCNGKDKKKIRR